MIIAEPTDPSPEGCELILVPPDMPCGIGWVWNGTNFIDPNPPTQES